MSARILVVDDVPHNVKLLEIRLVREYYEVVTAVDGPQALEMVKQRDPDIVLLDVMMPGMDGFEVCRRIKGAPETSHIRVVMVTSLSGRDDRLRGLEAGADDFLTKPVNDVILFARIGSLVRLKRTMDEWRLREASRESMNALAALTPQMDINSHSARILLVDDSAYSAKQTVEALVVDDHEVSVSADCEHAMEVVNEGEFDLVIVNLLLDDQDGLRLCSLLRSHEKTRQIPILTIVDEDDIERMAKGLELGVNDCIVSPVDRHEMVARTRSLVKAKRYQDRLRESYQESLAMALTDGLTGLYNRRYLETHLKTLLDQARAAGRPLSLLMVDIDYFKEINDTNGHAAGDAVLRAFARQLKADLRPFDMVARFGGDEFVIMMPGSDLETAVAVGKRLHGQLTRTPIVVEGQDAPVKVTASIGVAEADIETGSCKVSLKNADEALYEAKNRGRNCVAARSKSGDAARGKVPTAAS